MRANWARDPATGELLDEPANLATELVPHELLGALVRIAAAKFANAAPGERGRTSLAFMVEKLLKDHLPFASTIDDEPFLIEFESVPVEMLLDRHGAVLRMLHGYYAALMPPMPRAANARKRLKSKKNRDKAAAAAAAEGGGEGGAPDDGADDATISLREWLACLADVRLLGEHAITMLQAQKIFVLSQYEDLSTAPHAELMEKGGLARLLPNDTEMNLEEFGEALSRVAFELLGSSSSGADRAIPVGLGDEDGQWRSLVQEGAPELAFALEQLIGAILTRWKETDVQGSRTPAGRRMKAVLSAASAARSAAIGVARQLGVDAATDFLIAKAPGLMAKARAGNSSEPAAAKS